MTENPYEPPQSPSRNPIVSERKTPARQASRSVRLSVFLTHCLFLVLFPPGCCPCGFGMIGFLFQPYMILLGMPTILLAFLFPDLLGENRAIFFAAFIANYVVMSYLIGEWAGRIFGRKPVLEPDVGDTGDCPDVETPR